MMIVMMLMIMMMMMMVMMIVISPRGEHATRESSSSIVFKRPWSTMPRTISV